MTKRDIAYFRDEVYKGQPMIIVCDNEHNFFQNWPDQCNPVWDDEEERVMFLQTNQDSGTRSSKTYPFTISITEYEHIQTIKLLATRLDVMEFLKNSKDKMEPGDYEKAMTIISKTFGNAGPVNEHNIQQMR